MCKTLAVTPSGYYSFCKRRRNSPKYDDERREVHQLMGKIAENADYTYGNRRMRKALWALGFNFSRQKVRQLMKEAGIKARYRKKYKVTTNSAHNQPVFENLVARNFDVSMSDQVYCGDITYIATREGWLYLAVVIDLYSRKVVGWSMGSRMKAKLVCDALTMAIWQRQPAEGLIVHSDRGSQYASKPFRRLLELKGFKGSMSRKGDCWDNAVVESFFGSLKQERVQWKNYQTRYEAQQDILQYITMFYNSERLHSYLGYVSPNQFEKEQQKLKKVA